ncbi:MAG: XRE family transcriptional regulator [Betaproteobacteria bacterium]|nr:XRE family transcriptional regulator [Betaproteobacteria bacterium]
MKTYGVKKAVGAEIRKRRKAAGMTLEELAHAIGSNDGNLSKLERGIIGYTDDGLGRIAFALGCLVADFFTSSTKKGRSFAPPGSRRIPRLSYVQAGCWMETSYPGPDDDVDDWILSEFKLSQGAFALRIRGDSMMPEFREGDTVIIDPEVPPKPGDFVVAKSGGGEATFMKYRPRGLFADGVEVIELAPLNDDYPSMRSDITPITIIGTMVEHRRYKKN